MKIGDTLRFHPAAFEASSGEIPGAGPVPDMVTGTVVSVNAAHRWYRVRFEVHGIEMHETFKF